MKSQVTLMLVIVSLATSAFAGQLEYDLNVEGMKCAYCAFNVSKQLESIDDVVPNSVDVDLDQGRVTLQSETELNEAQLADVLLQAGFNLSTVASTEAASSRLQQQSNQPVLLSVTMTSDWINAGEFDTVLEALGAIAAERSGRVTVFAPVELETAILKPLLGGRQTVIKVDYDSTIRPDQPVVVSVNAERILSQ